MSTGSGRGQPNRPSNRSTTVGLGVGAATWSLLVGGVVAANYKLNGRPAAAAISLVPGVALFLFVMLSPTKRNIAIRTISALVGLVAVVVNARYMASSSCTGDALCGLNIVNAPAVEVGTFGILWVITQMAAQRRGRPPERNNPAPGG